MRYAGVIIGLFLIMASVACLPESTATSASSDDSQTLLERIDTLEERITYLEQGLDNRVIEYNMVLSGVMQMMADNGSSSIYGAYNSRWDPTNDMRLFPKPESPLFGHDSDGDGESDKNYFPYEKTYWFYELHYSADKIELLQLPDFGWEPRPTLEEVLQQYCSRTPQEIYQTELHNIQTAVMAMLADSTTGVLVPVTTATDDMDLVQTTDTPPLILSDYIAGLNLNGTVKSGCTYIFTVYGTVTQTVP